MPCVTSYLTWRAVIIMDQYGSSGSFDVEVVVVVAGDGEVPHPAVWVRGGATAVGVGSGTAAGSAEGFALVQRRGLDPLVGLRSVDWTNGFGVINLRAFRDGGGYGRVP
jgi:hypothetical protein